jgi:hypothetical protein
MFCGTPQELNIGTQDETTCVEGEVLVALATIRNGDVEHGRLTYQLNGPQRRA